MTTSQTDDILDLALDQDVSLSSKNDVGGHSDDDFADKDCALESGDESSDFDNSDTEEEDIKPAANFQANWNTIRTSSNLLFPTTCSKSSWSKNIPSNAAAPIDFFNLFLTDELIELMVNQTNSYAQVNTSSLNLKSYSRLQQWQPTNIEEMKRFFSVVIAMGVIDLPQINLYWSKDTLYHNTFISSTLTRDRFLLLLKCWRFNDSSFDRKEDHLCELLPVLHQLLSNFKKHMTPGEAIIIDESTISCNGHLPFRQHIKNKLHDNGVKGVKVYKLCTDTGYVLNIQIYTGKVTIDSLMGRAERIVDDLSKEYYGMGHTLFCDNFYTSVTLAEKLLREKTRLCGTVRENNQRLTKDMLKEKVRKGHIVGKQLGDVKFIKWMGKRPVLMVTTCEDHDDTLHDCQTKGGVVKKPKCVMVYNSARKGVDNCNQMASYHSPLRRGITWYQKVAIELLFGSAVTNAWILYNTKFPERRLSIFNFRDSIIKALCAVEQPPRPRTPKRIHTLTQNKSGSKKRRRCRGCYRTLRQASMTSKEADNKVKKVYTYCEECDGKPAYCLQCFNSVHEKVA